MIDGLTDPHKDGGLYHRPYGATRMRNEERRSVRNRPADQSRGQPPAETRPKAIAIQRTLLLDRRSSSPMLIFIEISPWMAERITACRLWPRQACWLFCECRGGYPEGVHGTVRDSDLSATDGLGDGRPAFSQLRAALLQLASGEVLEIGFGTGLNLRHYPTTITRLSIVDPATLLPAKVARRMAAAPYPIQTTHVTAENLPFPDQQFDNCRQHLDALHDSRSGARAA